MTIPGSLWAATLYKTYKQALPFTPPPVPHKLPGGELPRHAAHARYARTGSAVNA